MGTCVSDVIVQSFRETIHKVKSFCLGKSFGDFEFCGIGFSDPHIFEDGAFEKGSILTHISDHLSEPMKVVVFEVDAV